MKVNDSVKRSSKIRKDDTIKVTAGRDRGKTGKVLKVFPAKGTAIVENINFVKRATRANPNRNIKGGIIEKEAEINLSKLMLVCPECGKTTRVGRQRLEDGKKIRICRKCNGMIDK
ncbi:MAG: 50S ribosomal protein L24 [Acidobacteria bacterium]|nr:50S ribosomal protein L24 [Acidobacteriota bacterium]